MPAWSGRWWSSSATRSSKGSVVALIDAPGAAVVPVPAPAAASAAPAAAVVVPAAPREGTTPAAMPAHDPSSPDGAAPCLALGAKVRARTGRSAGRGQGQRPQGPHHADRRAGLRQGRDGRRVADRGTEGQGAGGRASDRGGCPACCPGRRSTSRSSATVERKDLGRIKKISGANLHRNWVVIPHVTNHDDADITELEAFRLQLNKEEREGGHQGHDAGLPDQGGGGRAEEVPRVQCQPGRRTAGAEEILPHRLCGRHAQRPGGAGDQGTPTRRASCRSARRWANWPPRRATASWARPT
jgi:hypothetical protein